MKITELLYSIDSKYDGKGYWEISTINGRVCNKAFFPVESSMQSFKDLDLDYNLHSEIPYVCGILYKLFPESKDVQVQALSLHGIFYYSVRVDGRTILPLSARNTTLDWVSKSKYYDGV